MKQLLRSRVLRFSPTCCVGTFGGIRGKGRRAACRPRPGGSPIFDRHGETVGRRADWTNGILSVSLKVYSVRYIEYEELTPPGTSRRPDSTPRGDQL